MRERKMKCFSVLILVNNIMRFHGSVEKGERTTAALYLSKSIFSIRMRAKQYSKDEAPTEPQEIFIKIASYAHIDFQPKRLSTKRPVIKAARSLR